jgi:hypothetical protein
MLAVKYLDYPTLKPTAVCLCNSSTVEVAAWPVVSNVERRLVLENKSLHNTKTPDGMDGLPLDENARAFVGQNHLQQRAELPYGIGKAGFARGFCHPQPINEGSAGILRIPREKA